ncbi:MAG: YigZ family protein [Desulfobacter sp.]|nr:YigZ family protein [Desulfobacter sp.]WDP83952.1 MAG: YigZ family protein [Desulfobacter sp.]
MNSLKYYYSVGRCKTDPPREAQIKIKRSSFICSLAYADSMAAAKQFITAVAREHKTATHNCWAYVVGDQGEISHCSDAGEPAGTAGKPMLNTLLGHDMTCVAAVVTRHFGGVKLGIRGLIEAYSLSVAAAIDQKPLIKLLKTELFRVDLSYGMNDSFLNRIKSFRAQVIHTDYGEKVVHDLEVELADLDKVECFLSEYKHSGSLEYTRPGLD